MFKKTDDDAKICDIEKKVTDHNHDKYITTPDFNKLTITKVAARLTQGTLIRKTECDNKLISYNRNINSNKTKRVPVENELKQLQPFGSSYFRGKSHFVDSDDTQNYFVFHPISR